MKFIIIYLQIVLFVLLCAACSPNAAPKFRIGVSQCSNDDWRSKMNDEIRRELMFHDDATVEIRSADDSNEKQIADIRYFMDNDFDIIIVAPNQAHAITPIVKEAFEAGIPIITFDRDIEGDSFTAHLEVDNYHLGSAAARYAASIADGPLNIIEIQGDADMTPTWKRHRGFADEIKNMPEARIVASVYGNWNDSLSAVLTDSLLRRHPEANLVYAHNDRMAISASNVARNNGLDHLKFIGIDGSPEIGIKAVADSVIDATFLYPTDGWRLVEMALAILKGQPYERVVCLSPLSAVDKSNADILLRQNTLLDEETSKIKFLQSKIDSYWEKHSAQTSLLYAAIAIAVLMIGVFILGLRMYWQRRRHQRTLESKNILLEQERDKQKDLYRQLEEAVQSKLMFFTNASHDLRTPLTLIAEPVNQLIENRDMPPSQRSLLLSLISKNVRILRRLIDQILDFRKYENGKLDLALAEANLPALICEWSESFVSLARKKDIKLEIDVPCAESMSMAVDVEKIERVFFNIMSNAFKYTPDNGKICVACSFTENELSFSVKDSGVGIPADVIGRIFERFYQADNYTPGSSGIGLALSKAFIELHGGSIDVSSIQGKGSCFTVTLPVRHVGAPHSSLEERQAANSLSSGDVECELAEVDNRQPSSSDQRPLLLVIDDNEDIRVLVKTLLCKDYEVVTANDGASGLRAAIKLTPDIIICDVMMPGMDGLECCKALKSEIATSHIPVLMLTACARDEQRAEGYENGADSYLSKPFGAKVLEVRCRNLIENRKRIKELYVKRQGESAAKESRQPAQKSRKPMSADIDNDFYARFCGIVSERMSDPDLSVDDIAASIGLSQSQLTRKIKSLTNYTPVEIIRNARLRKARELLLTSERPVSQVAFDVGFSLPAYFSKCFKDAFGESPTELRSRIGK